MLGVLSLILGTIFGFVLSRSGAADYGVVQGMFLFQGFQLYGIIGTAVLLTAPGVWLIRTRGRTVFGTPVQIELKGLTRGTLAGSLLFGIGWSITGMCPGPILVNIGEGKVYALAALAGALTGAALFGAFYRRLQSPRVGVPRNREIASRTVPGIVPRVVYSGAMTDRARALAGILACALLGSTPAAAQIAAQARSAPAPPWTKGIVPINPESYYNAIECGKQPGGDPPCVFWDTGLCKNPDFTLAMYTPYKMVAYEVWRVVQQKQPAPQPNYTEAQRTNVTVGVTPVRGSKNAFADLVLKRGGRPVTPLSRSLGDGGGRFTFTPPAFAATSSLTLDLVGKTSTISCQIDRAVLAQFR
jgi:hypothetical protein